MANVHTDPDFRLITIDTRGPIRFLRGGICGPIRSPFWERISTIADMVRAGTKVNYINPDNFDESLEATITNLRTPREELFKKEKKENAAKPIVSKEATLNKGKTATPVEKEVVADVEPTKVEKPVTTRQPNNNKPAANNTPTKK